jgi:uncharacterized membrane protein YgdD (TMEM256/DUF423 family)
LCIFVCWPHVKLTKMNKRIILIAAFFGMSAVALGAFGAHGLEEKISDQHLETWETAVDYHFYHTFALLFLSTFSRAKNNYIKTSFICFALGIMLFSGSLYLLSTYSLTGFLKPGILGPITPIGGVLFIVGWINLFIAAARNK